MLNFYAQLSAHEGAASNFFTSLAALTRLSRHQIRVFSADSDWTNWGV